MERPLVIGRYAIYGKIASGGMGTVHLGRCRGLNGFARTVAIKRLHPHHTENPDFVSMFLDEARLAARVRHPNVVETLDVVAAAGEVFLVLEYVNGATLGQLERQLVALGGRVPIPMLVSVVTGMLHGLHAAHEARDEAGEPLDIVHRDVSPQNVIIGVDGVSRVLDFGVAKAVGRLQTTRDGQLKGKLAYMAPEQVLGKALTRRCDIYATAVVLWESLAGRRLFRGDNEGALLEQKLWGEVEPPSRHRPEVPAPIDAVVMRGLARNPNERFATALEMATALEAAFVKASTTAVGAWVGATVEEMVSRQAANVAEVESAPETSDVDAVVSVRTIHITARDEVKDEVLAVTSKARAMREERESSRSLDEAAARSSPAGASAPEDSEVTIFADTGKMARLGIQPQPPPPSRSKGIVLAAAGLIAVLAAASRLARPANANAGAEDSRATVAAASPASMTPPAVASGATAPTASAPALVSSARVEVLPASPAASLPASPAASPPAPGATAQASTTATVAAPRRATSTTPSRSVTSNVPAKAPVAPPPVASSPPTLPAAPASPTSYNARDHL